MGNISWVVKFNYIILNQSFGSLAEQTESVFVKADSCFLYFVFNNILTPGTFYHIIKICDTKDKIFHNQGRLKLNFATIKRFFRIAHLNLPLDKVIFLVCNSL